MKAALALSVPVIAMVGIVGVLALPVPPGGTLLGLLVVGVLAAAVAALLLVAG